MAACPACESPVSETSRFCPTCGESLQRACPACSAAVGAAARFCDSCGARLGPHEVAPSGAGEERKLVSILFADLVGSTSLGESVDPERLRAVLQAYFGAMSAVIESWGGTIEKYIGDAIMAVFGVPVVHEDDAERALRSALGMLRRLDDLNGTLRARHGVALAVRVGVHTGEVIAPAGAGERQMLVTGDSANVAARLQQAAEPGTVLASDRTFLAVREVFDFGEPQSLELKGKASPVVGRVVRAARAHDDDRGVPSIRSSMIGRDAELGALRHAMDAAIESRRPRLVALYGAAGVGKSRLVHEFARLAESERGATVLRGRCLAAGDGITYWALGEILRAACGISLDDPAPLAVERLTATVTQLSVSDAGETVRALAAGAGIVIGGNPLDAMTPDRVAEELAWAWPRFVGALASRGPCVIVIEDLHWAGEELIEMIERIRMRSAGPLVIACTSRPEPAAALAPREDAMTITLARLTAEQSAVLLDELLDRGEGIPDDVRADLLEKTDGNPLFLEEMVRRLIDEGAVVREGDRWRASDRLARTILPDGVHALLAARIDALPPGEKRLLQEASVVGRVFWEQPVARALGISSAGSALLALERKDLIGVRPSSTFAGRVEYAFRHALVRDVAYETLPRARRARAHAGVADWIEEVGEGRIDELAELLAHHRFLAVAGEHADLGWEGAPEALAAARRRAFDALISAGSLARQRNAVRKALDLHEGARTLAERPADTARVAEELGDDHSAAFHGDEAVGQYREALGLLGDDPANRRARARVLGKMSTLYITRGGSFRASGAITPAQIQDILDAAFQATDDEQSRAHLLFLFAHSAGLYGTREADPVPIERRVEAAEEAWELAARSGDPELRASVGYTLAELSLAAGNLGRAREAAALLEVELGNARSGAARCSILEEVIDWMTGPASSFERALRLVGDYESLAVERSVHQQLHGTKYRLMALLMLGRLNEMPPTIDRHVQLLEQEAEAGCVELRTGVHVGAIASVHLGDASRGAELEGLLRPVAFPDWGRAAYLLAAGEHAAAWEEVAAFALDERRPRRARHISCTYVEAAAANGLWERVASVLEHLRDLAATYPPFGATLDRAEGAMLAAAGSSKEAVAPMRSALATFEGLGMAFEAARTREALADLLPREEGRAERARALDVYSRIGAVPHAARLGGA